ncbi:hypothetical protein ACFL3W_01210 [Pseudomonadota bacterium]
MGLLLGLIMGLSVSPTTKIVLGVIAAGLGTFLGFDKSAFKGSSASDNQPDRSSFLRELRVGSFGFAVVAGILLGMTIRTNELLSPTIVESVEKWTEAGYHPTVARQFVALERLRIDPKSGEVREMTNADKARIAALFGSQEKIALSQMIEAGSWAANMDAAITKANALDLGKLEDLLITINNNAPPETHQPLLANIKSLAKAVEQGDLRACGLSTDPSDWRDEAFADLSSILMEIPNAGEREILADATKTLLCSLEASR